jgi:SAM-dependent methyltransferase
MTDATQDIFDRHAVRRHRDRVASRFDDYGFLKAEIAERLADRLADVKRAFPLALDLGCHDGAVARTLNGRGGVETLVQADLSEAMARRARTGESGIASRPTAVADEEMLPFAERSFDLVTSVFDLHWTNDLPGALLQINLALKPDGLFLGALPGGETLYELRQSLLTAESEIEGGAGPRVSPMAPLQDAAGLLQRAGFALPVADVDRITITYPSALKLMDDLRGMGESNAVIGRRNSFQRRETLLYAAEIYQDLYGDDEGRVPATFDIVFLTAWRPDASQPQPLRPGSARNRLADALDTREIPTGVKPGET